MNLANLTHHAREIAELIASIREAAGDDDQAFVDTLEGETDAIDLARKVVRWLNEQEAHEKANKELAETYRARAKVFEDRQGRARSALLHFLLETGSKSMPLPEATLSVIAPRAKIVGEPDPAILPDALVRIKREPDKTAILAALKGGEIVPGCTLGNGSPSLMVKTRVGE